MRPAATNKRKAEEKELVETVRRSGRSKEDKEAVVDLRGDEDEPKVMSHILTHIFRMSRYAIPKAQEPYPATGSTLRHHA